MADYCEWSGKEPHEVMRLKEMGISRTVCLDFDLSVRHLKRFWDTRADATRMVEDTSPVTRKRMKPVRVHKTLAAVLGLPEPGQEPETKADATKIDRITNAFTQPGEIDWKALGYE